MEAALLMGAFVGVLLVLGFFLIGVALKEDDTGGRSDAAGFRLAFLLTGAFCIGFAVYVGVVASQALGGT